MLTIKELLTNEVNPNEIDLITIIHNGYRMSQYDSAESLIHHYGNVLVKDYDVEYDADEGMVYLDIETE